MFLKFDFKERKLFPPWKNIFRDIAFAEIKIYKITFNSKLLAYLNIASYIKILVLTVKKRRNLVIP